MLYYCIFCYYCFSLCIVFFPSFLCCNLDFESINKAIYISTNSLTDFPILQTITYPSLAACSSISLILNVILSSQYFFILFCVFFIVKKKLHTWTLWVEYLELHFLHTTRECFCIQSGPWTICNNIKNIIETNGYITRSNRVKENEKLFTDNGGLCWVAVGWIMKIQLCSYDTDASRNWIECNSRHKCLLKKMHWLYRMMWMVVLLLHE